jgi:glutamate formiminotransferase
VLESVVNVSEGRDERVVRALRAACGPSLLDIHTDVDHNRSVFTLAGPERRDASVATRALARAVAANVSIVGHVGVHPRFGALDVVPFVAFDADPDAGTAAVSAAHEFAHWWAGEFDVPVFFYGDADPQHRDLPSTRRTAFRSRVPDAGPVVAHPTLGATAVGVRAPLVAINCVLATGDKTIAVDIVRHTRERDGGLPGVRALAFLLAASGRTQVSMNLTDLHRTGVEQACTHVRALARHHDTDVIAVELVGLLPASELGRCSAGFLAWSELDDSQTIEARLRRGRSERL